MTLPQWLAVPTFSHPFAEYNFKRGQTNDTAALLACGFGFTHQPSATLTLPSGQHQIVASEKTPGSNDCWGFRIRTVYGMELGQYVLTIDHSRGKLIHTWLIDYYPCRILVDAQRNDSRAKLLMLMGLRPDELLTLHLYATSPDREVARYISSRSVQADFEGAAILELHTARSATFTANDIFVIPGNPDPKKLPIPKYPTYAFTNSLTGCGVGRYAAVLPRGEAALPVYQELNDPSKVIRQLDVADPVYISNAEIIVSDLKRTVWRKVQTEDGQEGWISGDNVFEVEGKLVPGARGEFDVSTLLEAPYDGAPRIKISKSDYRSVVFVARANLADTANSPYWYIKADNGVVGWQRCNDWCALPWAPVSVADIPVPPAATPPALSMTCPNSPPPRLRVGARGRVTPGDPNRLRDDPDGNVIGKIPGGETFDVLEGPRCASNGKTYWKVSYNGIIGWTGEGEGSIYWLEPIDETRPSANVTRCF